MVEPGATEPIRLLLVDDQAIVAEGIRRQLAAMECPARVLHHERAAGAVELALRESPDLILQDLVLPDGDGLDVVRGYREHRELALTPIVVLSSIEEPARKAKAFALGANDYLVKLPAPEELAARVRHHAQAHRAARERDALFAQLAEAEARLRSQNRELDELNQLLSLANSALASDVEERRTRLTAARRLGEELLCINDVDLLLARIVDEANSVAPMQACGLLVRDFPHDRYALEAARTKLGGRPARVLVAEDSIGLVGRAIRGERVVRCDGEVDLESPIAEALGVRPQHALAYSLRDPTARNAPTLAVLLLIDPLSPEGRSRLFGEEEERQLRHVAAVSTLAIERARLTRSMVLRMVRMAELRDPTETGAHVQRVAGYALVLFDAWAERRGIDQEERRRLRDRLQIAALLHDVGKVGISDAILGKPGKLDSEERAAMERHTEIGARLFGLFRTDFDEAARDVALGHHERWDGQGYPGRAEADGTRRGLRGEEIPLFARIVAVADVYDALTSARPYKPAWEEDRVIAHLTEQSGSHFDPELVAIAQEHRAEFRLIRERIEARGNV